MYVENIRCSYDGISSTNAVSCNNKFLDRVFRRAIWDSLNIRKAILVSLRLKGTTV
jgi:hypothetical protein